MPSISYDGQSLSIDGRRVWLVSGSIHYARVPRGLWRDRIRAARQAGLNCIDTPVFWNVHEPSPGQFDFQEQADLRAFVQLVAEEGLFCILRPGPYIGADWEMGGLPAWLHRIDGMQLRQANSPFLEASARYLGAVMEQVRDLQVTASAPPQVEAKMPGGGGGPIILMQSESEWLCQNPEQETAYLAELVRYLRENGAAVPILQANQFWTEVDGTIATWSGSERLTADLRQLRALQPTAPPIVSSFWTGWPSRWGTEPHEPIPAETHEYRLATMLAAGAQFAITPFHGGTSFGFRAGRNLDGPAGFLTTSYDTDAPLGEAGARDDKYLATKRICTFATQFGHVFAHLDAEHQPAAINPNEKRGNLAIVHQRGSQGQVIFLLRGQADRNTEAELLLPDGQMLTVPMGKDRVAWVLANARLGTAAELTWTNLRPWAFLGRHLLVLFGPAGAPGIVNINGAPLQLTVPTGRSPLVTTHEDLTIAVLSSEQVDAAYLTDDAILIGADALDERNRPAPRRGWSKITTITSDGSVQVDSIKPAKRITAPKLTDWRYASVRELIDGTSAQYQPIDQPASLEALGCDHGYGWYRFNAKMPRREKVMLPGAADRLHLFHEGEPLATIGQGPGAAAQPFDLKLAGTTTILADNLGRWTTGWNLGQPKGVPDHLYAVKSVRLPKPTVSDAPAPDLFALGGFFQHARTHESPVASRFTWSLKPVGRNPLIVEIDRLPFRAMLLVNDEPIGAYDPLWSAGTASWLLNVGEQIKAGHNSVTLALFELLPGGQHDPRKHLIIHQATRKITARADWAFTPWTVPSDDAFEADRSPEANVPGWHRGSFNITRRDVPLWFEPRGLSKGQLYLNGRNLGRYFHAIAQGKTVGPQKRYYLPEPWLTTEGPNMLLIFDEHGKSPGQSRLRYER